MLTASGGLRSIWRLMVPEFSGYYLARWSILIRQRDGMICFMCKRQCLKRREVDAALKEAEIFPDNLPHIMYFKTKDQIEARGLLGEAHHIRAKYHYPEKAYNLDNGVCLCWRCHRRVVHSTYQTFRLYVFMFVMAMRRKYNRLFNEQNQYRVRPRR